MKVYNTKFLRGNQRLVVAIIAGLVSSIGCAFLYAILVSILNFSSSLFYIAMAYAISYCIKTFGRGVEVKYCVIGACFTLFSILLGRMLLIWMPLGFNLLLAPSLFLAVLESFFVVSGENIIQLICVAYSLYLAYYNSRIV